MVVARGLYLARHLFTLSISSGGALMACLVIEVMADHDIHDNDIVDENED